MIDLTPAKYLRACIITLVATALAVITLHVNEDRPLPQPQMATAAEQRALLSEEKEFRVARLAWERSQDRFLERELRRDTTRLASVQMLAHLEAERIAAEKAAAAKAAAEEAARVAAEEAVKSKPKASSSGAYSLPVKGYRISATFGESGPHWSSTHTGLDLACPSGTDVVAVASGRIIFAGWDGAYGNKVVIEHGDGSQSVYGHLSSITGSGSVSAGEQIGNVGETGNTTGPHLHLEIRVGGSLVNPAGWLADHGVAV